MEVQVFDGQYSIRYSFEDYTGCWGPQSAAVEIRFVVEVSRSVVLQYQQRMMVWPPGAVLAAVAAAFAGAVEEARWVVP